MRATRTGAGSRRRLLRRASALAALALLAAGWVSPPVPRPRPPRDLALPARLPRRTLAVPILMYHRIGPLDPRDPAITEALTVPPAVFASQMRWLHRAGFHAITPLQLFDALERGARLPPSPVMITFDDGYRDVLWNAAPLLHRLRMPATAFVITDRVDGRDPSFLTWPELRKLEARGFAIGSHTVHHLPLTMLTRGQALYELEASRHALQRHLHRPVQWFAYPSGAVDASVLPLVRRAGYVLAFATRPGDLQSSDDPLELRRDEVLETTGLRGLQAILGR